MAHVEPDRVELDGAGAVARQGLFGVSGASRIQSFLPHQRLPGDRHRVFFDERVQVVFVALVGQEHVFFEGGQCDRAVSERLVRGEPEIEPRDRILGRPLVEERVLQVRIFFEGLRRRGLDLLELPRLAHFERGGELVRDHVFGRREVFYHFDLFLDFPFLHQM